MGGKKMRPKRAISILVPFLISLLLLWFLFSQIEAEDFFLTFSSIYFPALLVFIIISVTATILRAWRYKWLLSPHAISWGNILLVTFIRNLFVDLFPARIGSLSYIYFVNRRLRYPFESAASTFVLALILDFLTLGPFLAISIFLVGINAYAISNSLMFSIAASFFICIILIYWKLIPLTRILVKLLQSALKTARVDQKKWAKLAQHKMDLTIEDLVLIRKKRIFWPVLSLSFLLRMAKYGSLYFLLYSLLYSHGITLEKLSFFKTILGITGAELSSILPIKGIGGFGTWESAWALTFKLLDFEQRLAIISGLGVHLITNLFEYALGITSLLIISLPFIKIKITPIPDPTNHKEVILR